MVRVLQKKEKTPQNAKVKDDHAKMPGSLQLTNAGSFRSQALNPDSHPQTQAKTNKATPKMAAWHHGMVLGSCSPTLESNMPEQAKTESNAEPFLNQYNALRFYL